MLPLFIGLVAAASGAAVLESRHISLLEHFRAYQQRHLPPPSAAVVNSNLNSPLIIESIAAPFLADDSATAADVGDDDGGASTADDGEEEPTDEIHNWAERNQGTVIAAAVAVPLALLGMAGLSAYIQRNRPVDEEEDSESIDSAFGMRRGMDDEDESSVGGLTEDGFQSKFEVGNDAAMWAKQADFSAF